MSDAYLAPYLSFDGNCKEAMDFYHGVMGGELEFHTFQDYAFDDNERFANLYG